MRTRLSLAAAFLAAMLSPLPARAAEPLPADLALVPGDALGFVHVRLMDMWKHDLMKGLRETALAAGAKALAAFEKQAYPPPASIDRVTFFVLPPGPKEREPQVVGVIRFREAFDKAKLVKLNLPYAKETSIAGKSLVADADSDLAMLFPDDKHIVVSSAKGLTSYVTRAATPAGTLSATLQMAASGKALVAAVNLSAIPMSPDVFRQLPPDLHPLLKADRLVLTVDLVAAEPVLAVRASYSGEAGAADAEKALGAAKAMAKGAMMQQRQEMEKKLYADADRGARPIKDVAELAAALVALGGMNKVDAMLEQLPIKRDGTDLTASVTMPKEIANLVSVYSAGLGLMMPAVANMRAAAGSSVGANNLKQIALAMHNFHSTANTFPSGAICDKDGKPLLSWRVAILPYIEQDALYQQFKLDEPWDSETNKKLIPMMPKTYVCPRVDAKAGMTVYKVFAGAESAFDYKPKGIMLQTIPDGSSNTVLAIEGGDPVTWTKPEDFEFDTKKPLPKLELPGGIKKINVAMCDGSVRSVDLAKISEATWKIVIGRADGMVTPADWYGEETRKDFKIPGTGRPAVPGPGSPVPYPGKP